MLITGYKLTSPILFLIFNRPDLTAKVFEQIRKAKPARLYVAADGPRAGKSDEPKCFAAREVVSHVDWDCKVQTLFRGENLGCRKAISCAIDWFFSHENEGIILEDDCLPGESFFFFCERLLSKYRNDTRVMHISGDNFQNGVRRGNASYYFSRYSHVWGWATWGRAWSHYDGSMRTYSAFLSDGGIRRVFSQRKVQNYWLKMLNKTHQGEIDTWDYQWNYSIWTQNGLSVLPNVNLVRNIGFGLGATHTDHVDESISKASYGTLNEIIHPQFVLPNIQADSYTFRSHFDDSIPARIRRKSEKIIRQIG